MNIIIHNKDKSIVKQAANVSDVIKIVKQLTNVFNERFYITNQDIWSLNNSK